METVGSSETNLLSGKSDRKKTSLSSRSKSRQLRRSHAAVDNDDYNVANIHSASSLGVSVLLRMTSVCFIRTAVQREVEKIRQKTDKQTLGLLEVNLLTEKGVFNTMNSISVSKCRKSESPLQDQ